MSKLFLGGIPTDIDVRKLIDAFGKPEIGAEVTHEQIEEVLGIGRDTNRYRGVTLAWRKKLERDHNIRMGSAAGVGYRSLSPSERISAAIVGTQQGARKQLRAIRSSDRVVTDDPVLQKKQELLHRYGIAIASEANSTMKQIEPPKPSQQMPRLAPVRAA